MDPAKTERPGVTVMKTSFLTLLLAALALASADAASSSNLLANGSFDKGLEGWKCKYDKQGESWYFTNHERVKVEPKMAGRSQLLALYGDDATLGWNGTKADSKPVHVTPGGRYRLSASVMSTGPGARLMVEGYQWRPGVKPHPDPDLSELRKVFKSELVYFGSQQGGGISMPGKSWETGKVVFPDEKPSPLAIEKLAKMEFLVVHIVAISGSAGTLYLDDIKLEQVK
jgi:hypothetical protein